jgi:hypothetical protein
MWIQGLETQFKSAPFKEEQILLIQQVPPSKPVSPTLLNKNRSDYTFDIDSDPDRNKLVRDESSSLSGFQHVKLFDPADSICPNGSCTIAESGQSLYSDEFHLSPFGALRLKDQLIDALKLLISAD